MIVEPASAECERRVDPRWALVVLAIWVAIHLIWSLRALTPGPTSISRRLPWNMFSTPRKTTSEIRAMGRTAVGEPVAIPLDDYYRFARGATQQRGYAVSRFLLSRGHAGERRAFAEWLAVEVGRDGAPVVELVLVRQVRRIIDGGVRTYVLGRFDVSRESAGDR